MLPMKEMVNEAFARFCTMMDKYGKASWNNVGKTMRVKHYQGLVVEIGNELRRRDWIRSVDSDVNVITLIGLNKARELDLISEDKYLQWLDNIDF